MHSWCDRTDVKNTDYLAGILLHDYICIRSDVIPMYGSRSNYFVVKAK